MSPDDWRDVEVTFHFKVEDYHNTDGWYVHLGGGRHANPQPWCEGACYIFKRFFDGGIQFLKEQWHNHKAEVENEDDYLHYPVSPTTGQVVGDYDGSTGIIEGVFGDSRGKWELWKFCRYNVAMNDGSTAVKFECYYNHSGDKQTWNLVVDILDSGGWGNDGSECGGEDDQILNWGFPMVRFYWKNCSRVDWYGLTVREIIPQAPVSEDPGDTGGGGTGGQPEVPPAEQPTGKVAKIGSFRFSIASTLATSCDGVEPTQPPTDPNPPPDGGTDPPPPAGGLLSFKLAEYFRVGS